jgi:hypothetical protein
MKFNNIITEAMVDDLKIHKMYKSILKKMNEEDIQETEELSKLSKEVGAPLHIVFSLYQTYLKYKDILFSEQGIEIVKEYDVFAKENESITRRVLLEYIEKNYINKTIFNSDGITGIVEFWEPIDTMVEEGMGPAVYVSMPVNGEYVDSRGETFSGSDVNFGGSLTCNIIPWSTAKGEQRMGYDFMTHDEETFVDWQDTVIKNGKYDTVDSGYLKLSALPKPKNYSDEEIKKYVDRWIMIQQRIIKKSVPLLLSYKDYVEEGDTMFD